MLTILACVFVFGILVTVHEFGHFITAKLTGMKVEEFSIGFGPKIYQQQEGETLYSLRMLPLGGYNKIAGMDPEDPDDPSGFRRRPEVCQAYLSDQAGGSGSRRHRLTHLPAP